MSANEKLVIAIDPGERVGWCTAKCTPDSIDLVDHGITELKPFALALGKGIDKYDVVVFEKWTLFAGQAKKMVGSEMQTSQLVGMIRYIAWAHGKTLVSQAPTIKKTADKVAQGDFAELIGKESGVHDDAHDIDAIRHMYYYWWKKLMKEVTNG